MTDILAGAAITLLAVVVIPLGVGYLFLTLSRRILKHIIREVLREMGFKY